jgi:hypothetical protein
MKTTAMIVYSGLATLVLACFALSPAARADCREGCDLGHGNTFLGDEALVNNTTGIFNSAMGLRTLFNNTTGSNNTATGFGALFDNTTGYFNTATGVGALQSNTTGYENTADGLDALAANTSGINNTATGWSALDGNTTGNDNTAVGVNALLNNTSGINNIALGGSAGSALTTGDNNIDIGNTGVAGESNNIRIGTQGTHTATFIAGISGAGVMGVAVKVNAAGQLGTAPSSARFKENIKPMDKASEAILALKPVSFHYKKEVDPEGVQQFGLVAEDVEKVNPALVVRDEEGKPYSVRYDAVNAMLLNEFLKEHREVEEQERRIQGQEANIAQQRHDFQAALAEQQTQIQVLASRLKEQESQIQKVSAQIEVSKQSPQTVLNDQ